MLIEINLMYVYSSVMVYSSVLTWLGATTIVTRRVKSDQLLEFTLLIYTSTGNIHIEIYADNMRYFNGNQLVRTCT